MYDFWGKALARISHEEFISVVKTTRNLFKIKRLFKIRWLWSKTICFDYSIIEKYLGERYAYLKDLYNSENILLISGCEYIKHHIILNAVMRSSFNQESLNTILERFLELEDFLFEKFQVRNLNPMFPVLLS